MSLDTKTFRKECAVITAIVIGLSFILPAMALPSMVSYDNINIMLVTEDNENWTTSGGTEYFNFTLSNTNATLEINQINISMPISGVNAVFDVDNTTIATNRGDWNCYNRTSDGVGNITLIECNTLTGNLTNATGIYINFSATASSISTENIYNWNVTVLNVSNGYTVSQNITSGIDGQAPRFSVFGRNATYFSNDIKMWVKVNDRSLVSSKTVMTIVNASNVAESIYGLTENCSQISAIEWNCTAVWSPSTDGNYTFNISANDSVGYSNMTTFSEWFFYDAIAPTVTLNYPANNSWDADGDVEFNFTPYDTSGSFAYCSVWVGNSTGGDWQLNDTDSNAVNNQMNNITVYGFSTDSDQQVQYIWNVRCWDSVANSSFATQNFTVNVGNRSNILVSSVTFDETEAPYAYAMVTVNVTLQNNGTANVENNTAVTVYFDDDSDPAASPLTSNSSVVVQNTSLPNGSYYSIIYEFNASAGDAQYYVLAAADSGTGENEQYENDNSKQDSFSTLLNVTINDVTGSPNPGENVTVNVTVSYNNGTGVTGLSIDDFTLLDKWNALNMQRTETNAVENRTGDFSETGGGVYTFNYTVPDPQIYSKAIDVDEEWYTTRYAEYGLHAINVIASATDNTGSTGNYTGNSSYTGSYNLTAPFLRLVITSLSNSLEVDDSDTNNKHIFYNDGVVAITSDIAVDAEDDPNAIFDFDFFADGEPDTYTIAGGLTPGSNNETLGHLYAEAAGTANLTSNGSYTYDGGHYYYVVINEITVSAAGDGDGNGDGNGDTGIGGVQYECLTNASCDSDEYCATGFVCEEIECEEGYYATGHTCKVKPVYEVLITEYESSINLTQGESTEIVVFVKNTGNKNIAVSLAAVLELEGLTINITPPMQGLDANETGNYTVDISSTEEVKVGKYEGTFSATTSSIAKSEKKFTLIVNPLPETIVEIESDYQNLTAIVNALLADFNAGKGALSGDNLTALENKVNETEELFNSLRDAIEDEDYAQASVYIDELNSLISSTRDLMEEFGISGLGSSFWNAIIIWIIVAVVAVGAVGLLIYMMVPPQGYTMGKGYSPKGKGSIGDKLKNAVLAVRRILPGKKPKKAGEIVTKHRPAYSGSYRKVSDSYQQGQRPASLADRMRSRMKRSRQ
ncbi:MAG: hypothetical protein JSV63_00505 [Candidatus Aenigmatarchaeota archaeon]|nr:MAG: hypothetical protein JSV63_00505 [Candidatus Aenigmarchaeota archaeon]